MEKANKKNPVQKQLEKTTGPQKPVGIVMEWTRKTKVGKRRQTKKPANYTDENFIEPQTSNNNKKKQVASTRVSLFKQKQINKISV